MYETYTYIYIYMYGLFPKNWESFFLEGPNTKGYSFGGLSILGFHYLQFKGIWGFETLSPKPRIEGVGVMEGHAWTQWLIKIRMGNLVLGGGYAALLWGV